MKTFTLILSFVLLTSYSTSAQTTPQEFPIGLTVSGSNKAQGVEASYSLGKCGVNDVVFIIFNNTNVYPITIDWYDGVFTTDLKWIKKEDALDKKTIQVPANSSVRGNCTNNNLTTVALKTFGVTLKQLKRYGALNFTITTNN